MTAARRRSDDRALTALLAAIPGKQEELLQTLRSLVVELQSQPGCTRCVLGQDVAGAPHLLLYVAWVDALAMEASMSTEPFRVLLGATSTLSAQADFRFSVAGTDEAAALAELPRGPGLH